MNKSEKLSKDITMRNGSSLIDIYRIENEKTMNGMWYSEDATYSPFIMKLTEGKSRDLPMKFHEKYSEGGLRWFSGCVDRDILKHWFSELDTIELLESGYKLFHIKSQQFSEEENEVLFTREGIVSKVEIDVNKIWLP